MPHDHQRPPSVMLNWRSEWRRSHQRGAGTRRHAFEVIIASPACDCVPDDIRCVGLGYEEGGECVNSTSCCNSISWIEVTNRASRSTKARDSRRVGGR